MWHVCVLTEPTAFLSSFHPHAAVPYVFPHGLFHGARPGWCHHFFSLLFSNTRTTSPRQRCQGRRYCCTTRLPQRHVKNRVASTRRRYRNKRIPDTLHALNVGYGSTSMTLRSQHRRSKNRRVHKAKRLTLTKKPS